MNNKIEGRLQELSGYLLCAESFNAYDTAIQLSNFTTAAKTLFKKHPEKAKKVVKELDSNVIKRRKSIVRHELYKLQITFGMKPLKLG